MLNEAGIIAREKGYSELIIGTPTTTHNN